MKKKTIIVICAALIIMITTLFLRAKSKTGQPSPSPELKNLFNLNGLIQTPNDFEFGQALVQLNQKYPWYAKLPLETADYRIVYDFDKNSFRIRLLTAPTEIIKQAAVAALKNLGVDLNTFTYYFLNE